MTWAEHGRSRLHSRGHKDFHVDHVISRYEVQVGGRCGYYARASWMLFAEQGVVALILDVHGYQWIRDVHGNR